VTEIPGAALSHAIITPTCMTNRGIYGALDEAIARLTDQYVLVIEGWRDQPVMPTIHVVLTVERPDPADLHSEADLHNASEKRTCRICGSWADGVLCVSCAVDRAESDG